MIFTSLEFALFFLLLVGTYAIIQKRASRQWLLFAASMVFYGWWDIRFLSLIILVILTSYWGAIGISNSPRHRKAILIFTISIQLGVLGVFKYFNFFVSSMASLLQSIGIEPSWTLFNIILPVGISFYTFQGISYLVDVYRGDLNVERSWRKVALYISFFPQLVAGPIVRASNFIPQLGQDIKITNKDILVGLQFFLIGLIYKGVFADRIALQINPIFTDPKAFDNLSLWIAALGFHSQIYFDFAGYSTMAIGIARLLGYHLPTNFNYPYLAATPTDFWRRWHISLSTWLRDYLYISMGGNKKGFARQQKNLMTTMLLGGLWHGASWNFLLWGGVHGLALVYHKTLLHLGLGRASKTIASSKTVKIFWTILAWLVTQYLVLICWMVFRLPDFGQAWEVITALIGMRPDNGLASHNVEPLLLLPVWIDAFLIGSGALAWLAPKKGHLWWRFAVLGIVLALVLTLMPLQVSDFIYFKF